MSNFNQIFGSRTFRRRYADRSRQHLVSRSRFLIAVLVCAGGFVLPACRGSQVPPASNTGSAGTRKTTFTTPPFSTKEPDRYQAIRITTFTETGSGESSSSSQSNQVLIARDGEKRREEYLAGASGQIVYFELPTGRYVVLPAGRVYADLSAASLKTDPGKHLDDSVELSADQLVNESHAPATYERLGTEELAGRMTTKYRVVVVTGVDSQNETLVWIDEVLGIPVRSEAISRSSGHSSKVTTELREVKLEVDERLFSWPSDYRMVEAQLIFDLIRKQEKSGTSKQED